MFTETEDGLRRLCRAGVPVHPYRGGKMYPRRDEIPEQYGYAEKRGILCQTGVQRVCSHDREIRCNC
jgi:hypothetical protein